MAKKKTTSKNETKNMSFEQAIESLTGIVEKIETGRVSLAESLSQYEKGMELIKHCRGILLDAEKRIEKVTKDQQTGADLSEDDEALEDADDEDSLF